VFEYVTFISKGVLNFASIETLESFLCEKLYIIVYIVLDEFS